MSASSDRGLRHEGKSRKEKLFSGLPIKRAEAEQRAVRDFDRMANCGESEVAGRMRLASGNPCDTVIGLPLSDQAPMSGIHSETVRFPADRSAGNAPSTGGREGEPVVLRFPERSRIAVPVGAADQPVRPLWIHGYRGKRTFDMIAGGLLALTLMPVGVVIASILALLNRGRVFERTVVVGGEGRTFDRLRFRTRGVLGSASTGQEGERQGQVLPLFCAASVPRTRFGRFLHATGLERVPELWNVLTGDLALIGPAARMPDQADSLSPLPPRWDLKPGFVWVAEPAHEAVIGYVAAQGIWTDLRILAGACWRLTARAFTSLRSNQT